MAQSTWEMMSPAQQAQCADAGRGPYTLIDVVAAAPQKGHSGGDNPSPANPADKSGVEKEDQDVNADGVEDEDDDEDLEDFIDEDDEDMDIDSDDDGN